MITLVKALSIVSYPDVTRETNQVNLLFQRIIIDNCEKQNINFADFAKHLHIDVRFFFFNIQGYYLLSTLKIAIESLQKIRNNCIRNLAIEIDLEKIVRFVNTYYQKLALRLNHVSWSTSGFTDESYT